METHKYPFGVIGNCAYLALVDDKANIAWMCWPRFDSSFVFGTLLDDEKGGRFFVRPEWDNFTSVQNYIENTNVLETTFHCEDGIFKVVDFAPRFYLYDRSFKPLMLVRKIVPLEGRPRIRVSCQPTYQYGNLKPGTITGSNHLTYTGLGTDVRLTTNIPITFVQNEQAFVLSETKHLVLTWGEPLEKSLEDTVEQLLDSTIKYWRSWVMKTSTEHFHQDAVIRSALTLKMHQYQDTGAFIAASTTSLPEFPGSTRNWDYRYCWLRDAHYTLKALNDLSHFEILKDYAIFIENIILGEDQRIHPLYPIGLDHLQRETILPLKGYLGERPVRVGNQAEEHIQNDVYGQVLVTLLPLFNDKRLLSQHSPTLIAQATHCLDMIELTMEEPDNGIWEFRGLTQLHCYTFLFHWAGSHAALKIAKNINDKKLERKAAKLIKAAAAMIERCFDAERGVYTQAVGSPNLDASNLQLINMGYLNPQSPRAKRHLEVLEENLKAENGLFFRYKHIDDFGAPESTFLICAFWYVEALARTGRVKEAVENFEQLLQYSNHLGLFSEDVHAVTGSQWGNFPQTYSHVGLINAAFTISRKLDKPTFV